MAYSTGSGDYIALMAAVLVHALADGWVETGGLATGWPISKGLVRGVDFTTYTASEDDLTEGGDGLTKTQRYIRLGLGTTGANATANAVSGAPEVANMAYTFIAWHIFSETAVNDHIHVVANFSNNATVDCWTHFSFGEVDAGGLTYGSVAYATGTARRAYAATTAGGATVTDDSSGLDWNTLNRAPWPFCGEYGASDNGAGNLAIMIHGTTAPSPNAVGGYPAWDTQINAGANVWAKTLRQNDIATFTLTPDRDGPLCNSAMVDAPVAAVGQISLLPMPVVLLNGELNSSRSRYLGVFPNVRVCNVEGVLAGQEFTFGSDVWKVFPMTRSTADSDLNVRYKVTSGRIGFAYKKV